jgi:hypothetical protein
LNEEARVHHAAQRRCGRVAASSQTLAMMSQCFRSLV